MRGEEKRMTRTIDKMAVLAVLTVLCANITYAGTNFNYSQPVYSQQYTQQGYGTQSGMPSTQNDYQDVNQSTLKGNVIMIPAGTAMNATLTAQLSSSTAAVGQSVTMSLQKDFYYDNKLIAPAGSTVQGTVIEANKAKHGSMNGKLSVRFNQICTPTGMTIPISAVIRTDDSSGVLVGGTKKDVTKEYAKDLAAGSAVGALSGLVFGSLASGDKLGRGVALGTAVGAGGGLAKSIWDKGNDVEIPAGASVDLILTQPATVSSMSYQFRN